MLDLGRVVERRRPRGRAAASGDGTGRCEHLDQLSARRRRPARRTGARSVCATGSTWVHLRLCMTCGHVGCCDSSVGKHADEHYAETGHPVMRSFEPGEAWRWCYVDEVLG